MNKKQSDKLCSRMNQAHALLREIWPAVDNYPNLMSWVFRRELWVEVEFLEQALSYQDNFIDLFRTRCAQRQKDKNCIRFDNSPDTLANKLYWDLAHILSPGEEISLLFPLLKEQVAANVVPSVPINGKKTFKVVLESTSTIPQGESVLNNYALAAEQGFDVESAVGFPLPFHRELRWLLNTQNPSLAQVLYSHNHSFWQLERDMTNNTLRDVLTELCHLLESDGSRKTGQEFAGKVAEKATHSFFFDYINQLPRALQNGLNALETGEGKYGQILEFFKQGACVQETSRKTRALLQNYPAPHEVLDAPLGTTENDYIVNLHKKYNNKTDLEIKKTLVPSFKLPPARVQDAFQTISLNKISEFCALLYNIPIELYDSLFTHVKGIFESRFYMTLATAIAKDTFNAEQDVAITTEIIKHLGIEEGFIFAVHTRKQNVLRHVLTKIPQDDIPQFLQLKENTNSILLSFYSLLEFMPSLGYLGISPPKPMINYLAEKPKSLATVLAGCSEQDANRLFLSEDGNGVLLAYHLLHLPTVFKAYLDVYSEAERKQILERFLQPDVYGKTIMHYAAATPALEYVATLYSHDTVRLLYSSKDKNRNDVVYFAMQAPVDNRIKNIKFLSNILMPGQNIFNILTQHTFQGQPLIFSLNEAEFKLVFPRFTTANKNKILLMENYFQQTLMERKAQYPEFLYVMSHYNEKKRVSLVKKRLNWKGTVLHHAAPNELSLHYLLHILPPHQRISEVITRDNAGNTILHKAVPNAESLKILFELYSDNDAQINAMSLKNYDGNDVFDLAIDSIESLQFLLSIIPPHKRLELFLSRRQWVIEKLSEDPKKLSLIISMLPKEDRFKIIQGCNAFNLSLSRDSNSLQSVLGEDNNVLQAYFHAIDVINLFHQHAIQSKPYTFFSYFYRQEIKPHALLHTLKNAENELDIQNILMIFLSEPQITEMHRMILQRISKCEVIENYEVQVEELRTRWFDEGLSLAPMG